MNILALDLGTKTGWARRSRGVITSGTASFTPKISEGRGRRWANFRVLLAQVAKDADLGAIYVEELIHAPINRPQTVMMFGGFMAHLEFWCEINRVPLHTVHLATIKKHWTGRGDAKKPDMMRVARERGYRPKDDNEADALALLDYALCAEGEGMPTPIEAFGASPIAAAMSDVKRLIERSKTAPDPFSADQ